MLLRRLSPFAVLALAALACEPSVPKATNPTTQDYAVFDPQNAQIPLPNDLALPPPAGPAPVQPGAQGELLAAFAAQGGFPNDQEVPITIDFVRLTQDASGNQTPGALQLDLSTINTSTLAVVSLGAGGAVTTPYDPPRAADYVIAPDGTHGTLTLHKSADPVTGRRLWSAGTHYFVGVRGGPNGVKTQGGGIINPQATTYILAHADGRDLSKAENQGLLPGATPADRAAAGAKLEQLHQLYLIPFSALDSVWCGGASACGAHHELAAISTFLIAPSAPGATQVLTDPQGGVLPLPSDLLLGANGSPLPLPAFGAAAQGLATLDGFSTTGALLAQTSGPIVAPTVNASSVFLYKLTATGAVRQRELKEADATHPPRFVAQPTPFNFTPPGSPVAVSAAVVLQPGIPVINPANGSYVAVPPLDDASEYVVVITDGVAGATKTGPVPLTRSTLGTILLLGNPIADASGHSLLAGIADGQAAGLEKIRQGVALAAGQLKNDKNIDKAHIVMAYTVKTQSITSTAVQLAALPYLPALGAACNAGTHINCSDPVPGTTVIYSQASGQAPHVTDAFDKYGVSGAPLTNIGTIFETKVITFDLHDDATGAFKAPPGPGLPPAPAPTPIDVLLSVPKPDNAALQPCAPSGPLAALKCVPLAIFRHGVFGSKASMLTIADNFNKAGIAVASFDAQLHGARALCNAGLSKLPPSKGGHNDPDFECDQTGGVAHCVPSATLFGGALDPSPPGVCKKESDNSPSPLKNAQTLCVAGGTCTFTTPNAGQPIASGNYFISANFFRTRDAIRQDLIDAAQVIKVLEVAPGGPADTNAAIYNALAAQGLLITPGIPTSTPGLNKPATFMIGQSLGGMYSVLHGAANARIGQEVLNVPGGTIADVFSHSPAFSAQFGALLTSQGINPARVDSTTPLCTGSEAPTTPCFDPAAAAKYVQLINVVKWILDPADPVNFATHLRAAPLPNLLPPFGGNTDITQAPPQPAKDVLEQVAMCDVVVPNPFNLELAGLIGLTPPPLGPIPPAAGGSGTLQYFTDPNGPAIPFAYPGPCPAGVAVPHGFLTSFGQGAGAEQANVAVLTNKAQNDAAAFLLRSLVGAPNAQPTVESVP